MSGIGLGGLLLKSGLSVYVSGMVAWPLDICIGQLAAVKEYHVTHYYASPSITDGVHRNENLVEIIPVFSTFSNFFKKEKKNYKSHFM